MRTRRAFKAMLAWDAEAGKVNFEFAPSKFPPRKTAASKSGASSASSTRTPVKKAPAKKVASAKTKAPRKTTTASAKVPSPALAAVIGAEPVARTEVMKKLWDYIKANNLQDPQDKRVIRTDAKLRAVFGADSVGMMQLAGIAGKHLG